MSRLIVPPGLATGCLPKTTRIGEVCSLFREKIDVLPQEEWKPFIGQTDLRPRVRRILYQKSVGSCAAEAQTQYAAIMRDWAGQVFVLLNPWFMYHTTSGGHDSGSSLESNLVFAREKGIVPQSIWPRSKGWRKKPSDEAYEMALNYRTDEFYEITSTEEVGTALLREMPVVFGWQGHSCVLTKLIDERTAEYANSWGESWGDHGFGTLRLSAINFRYGCYAGKSVSGAGIG